MINRGEVVLNKKEAGTKHWFTWHKIKSMQNILTAKKNSCVVT